MDAGIVFSLDRIEGDCAVLLGDNDERRLVPVSELSPCAEEGTMYRDTESGYVADHAATRARREQIRALQNRLRRRRN